MSHVFLTVQNVQNAFGFFNTLLRLYNFYQCVTDVFTGWFAAEPLIPLTQEPGFYRWVKGGGDPIFLRRCATLGLVRQVIMVWAVLWLIQKMMLSSDWRKIYACSGKRGVQTELEMTCYPPEGTPEIDRQKETPGKCTPDGVVPRRACNN